MEPTNNGSLKDGGTATLLEKNIGGNTLLIVKPQTEIAKTEEIDNKTAPAEYQEKLPENKPKKSSKNIILAFLGIGAVVIAGKFGYSYWRYATTHQETDNATVAGHIHNVSSRINGNVAEVLVNDNQIVNKGQLLVKLDANDYQVKVNQAKAALEVAKKQAGAAAANINLAAETAKATTTQAKGDIGGAEAAIENAKAAVQEAESGIPAAQATLAQAQTGVPVAIAAVKEAETGVAAAEAQLAQAEANLQKAEADYNRYNSLYTSGAISHQQLDTAKAAYQVALSQKNVAIQGIQQAKARVAQAQEGVTKAQAQITEAKEGIAKAEAKLAQAKENVSSAEAKYTTSQGSLQQAGAKEQQTEVNRAQYEASKAAIVQSEAALKDAELQLSYTNIIAPAAGRIGKKNIEVGQRVQAGTPLLAIVSNEYWITANFKETQMEKMKPGQAVEIKLDAFPHKIFLGRLDSVSPASGAQFALLPPDNATGNYTKIVQRIPVKIVFDADSIKGYENRITPGMSAVISVDVAE